MVCRLNFCIALCCTAKQVLHFSIFHSSLADQKKEEGNQLYLAKNYREALQRYNEAISEFLCDWI